MILGLVFALNAIGGCLLVESTPHGVSAKQPHYQAKGQDHHIEHEAQDDAAVDPPESVPDRYPSAIDRTKASRQDQRPQPQEPGHQPGPKREGMLE